MMFLVCFLFFQDIQIEKLDDDNPAVRVKAANELVAMGDKALPAVRAALAKATQPTLKSELKDVEAASSPRGSTARSSRISKVSPRRGARDGTCSRLPAKSCR